MQIRTVKLLMLVFVKNVKLIGIVATLLNRSFNVIQRLDDVYLFGKQEIVSTISFLTITTYRNLENIMGNCLLFPQAKINPENYNEWINKYIIIIVIMRKSIEHDTVKRNNMCKRIYLWLDILFSSNPNIHKSSYGLCFWASDPLIENF